MSMVVCALSGVPPEEPVYSKTGYVFEKRIIEKHIDINGKCPVTGDPLTKDDLFPIHCQKLVKSRPVTASSIPGLLSLFQSEWDSLMSETYSLRTHLDTVRNQLSHSLYQHDAATRVIARLIKERDEMKEKAEDLLKQLMSNKTQQLSTASIEPGISDELELKMQTLAKNLLSTRKKRHIEGTTSVEEMKTLKCVGEYPLHSSVTRGVCCCSVDQNDRNLIATGGVDGAVVVFDILKEKTTSKLLGHIKKINSVKLHPTDCIVISASEDKTIRIWKGDDELYQFKCAHTIKKHKGPVNSLSIHPLNDYVASCGKDRSWAFHEIDSGITLQTCRDLSCDYQCLSFHPDGMILGGGGTDGNVHIWDMKGTKFRASLAGHKGPISRLSFSENGYYLATSSEDGTVRLWDLRKSLSFQIIKSEEESPMHSVCFDYSGQYIAIASANLSVYYFETRTNAALINSFNDHSDYVTDVGFGPNASYLVSTSLDRTVRLWRINQVKNM